MHEVLDLEVFIHFLMANSNLDHFTASQSLNLGVLRSFRTREVDFDPIMLKGVKFPTK